VRHLTLRVPGWPVDPSEAPRPIDPLKSARLAELPTAPERGGPDMQGATADGRAR
jgi:hypothetical protein